MKKQLITITPLARVHRPVGAFPAVRSVGDPDKWTAPDGHAYVPIIDRPIDAPADGYRWQRVLTAEADDWEQVLLPVTEVDPLTEWWDSLTILDRVAVYDNAPAAILAWQRGERDEMVQLILRNSAPELADLKAQVQQLITP